MSRSTSAASGAGPARRVPVRKFKDHLSEYLEAAEQGHTVTVTSHGRPVADLVPHEAEGAPLRVRKATRRWGSVAFARKGKGRSDSVALLLEERRRR